MIKSYSNWVCLKNRQTKKGMTEHFPTFRKYDSKHMQAGVEKV